MSVTYDFACFTCQTTMRMFFATGSGFHGFRIRHGATEELAQWLGDGKAVGTHEGHDVRLVSEHVDLPWEYDGDEWIGERHDPEEAP